MESYNLPNKLMSNFSIFMGNHVSLSDNAPPRNFRVFLLEFFGDTIGSFPDDL